MRARRIASLTSILQGRTLSPPYGHPWSSLSASLPPISPSPAPFTDFCVTANNLGRSHTRSETHQAPTPEARLRTEITDHMLSRTPSPITAPVPHRQVKAVSSFCSPGPRKHCTTHLWRIQRTWNHGQDASKVMYLLLRETVSEHGPRQYEPNGFEGALPSASPGLPSGPAVTAENEHIHGKIVSAVCLPRGKQPR